MGETTQNASSARIERVEPCEHGKTAAHQTYIKDRRVTKEGSGEADE